MAAQAAAEERVRQDYTGRYPMELLQNAHDACAEAGRRGRVQFRLSETALLVANEGIPFDEAHIESLVNLGISEKTTVGGKRKTIGYKGIGFSSVFEISDNPQIITNRLAFSFDREQARATVTQALGRRIELVPVRAFPFRIDEADWSDDADIVAGLFCGGAVSVVRLPLRDPALRSEVAASLRASLPAEVLLFSPFLRSIQTTVGEVSTTWRRTSARRHAGGRIVYLEAADDERRGWLVGDGTLRLSGDLVTELDDRLWAEVRELSYAVALPWQGGILDSKRPQSLHVYYPTDDVLDRAILVHGDFYVTSDRRRIEVNGPGGKISHLVADAAAATLARLAESVADAQGGQLLRALAPSGGSDGFGHQMGEAIDSALRSAKIARAATRARRAPGRLAVFDARHLDTATRDAFAHMFGRQPTFFKLLTVTKRRSLS